MAAPGQRNLSGFRHYERRWCHLRANSLSAKKRPSFTQSSRGPKQNCPSASARNMFTGFIPTSVSSFPNS